MTTRLQRLRRDAEAERQLAHSFERRVRLSRYAILAERLWEALLWPAIVVMAFLVVSLLQLWSFMPPLLHRVLLGAFAVALLVSLASLLRLRWPSRDEAIRRIERRAGIKHRPASSYEDTLAGTHPASGTRALWIAHRRRLASMLQRLKPSWPEPRNDRRDPFAVRAALFLALVVAAIVAGPSAGKRIAAAFSPAPSQAAASFRVDAWLSPPVYTNVAPIVLDDGTEPLGPDRQNFRALSVPVRSVLTVRAHAPKDQPVGLVLGNDIDSATEAVAPKTNSDGLSEFDVKLTKDGTAKVEVGSTILASWRFKLTPDDPPAISLAAKPTQTPRGSLRLAYKATDDYGVHSARAVFTLANPEEAAKFGAGPTPPGGKAEKPLFPPPVMNLPLDQENATAVQGRATQDLTAHPWAGMKVDMTLIAKDQAGQTGRSETYSFILPERTFTKPLAKAVIEQRKKLVANPKDTDPVAEALNALTIGAPRFIKDRRVYLGLRSAYWRLEDDNSRPAVKSVVDQLWDVALRIEEGDLPDAQRALQAAQERLQKALQNGASPQQIQKLVDALKQAVAKYLQAMAKQNPAQPQQQSAQNQQAQNGQQSVSQQQLNKMMDDIQKLAQSGSSAMAQKMLSQLNDLLQRLQAGKTDFAKNGEQQRQMQQALQNLDSLINKQQHLLDKTFAAEEKSGQNREQQFQVFPPGNPMQFGMSFPQLYGMQQQPNMRDQMNQDQMNQNQMGENQTEQNQSGHQQLEQRGQQQRPGGNSAANKQLAQEQQALMKQLQNLINSMKGSSGHSQGQLGSAGQSMKSATNAIGQNKLDSATQHQGMALQSMRQGAQAMAQQMMQTQNGQQGMGTGQQNEDPLGRPNPTNQPDLGLSVKVPDRIDIQRAREVLDELRKRLADPNRPMIELDYLDRLIHSY